MSAEIRTEIHESLFADMFADVCREVYSGLPTPVQHILNQGLIPAEAYHREHPEMTAEDILDRLEELVPCFKHAYRIYEHRTDALLLTRYGVHDATRIIRDTP